MKKSLWTVVLANSIWYSSSTRWWLTSADANGDPIALLEEQQPLGVGSDLRGEDSVNLTVNTLTKFQMMTGYGAGLPQSSASVLLQLKSRDQEEYSDVMDNLFGTDLDQNKSMGLSMVRFPLGSCDFSLGEYTYDDVAQDWTLESFQLDDDSLLIAEVLTDALAINPNLILAASAWSPPGWLKVDGTVNGGSDANTLLRHAFPTYAAYLAKAAKAWHDIGLPLHFMSLQNEPLFGTANYPGMYLSASDAQHLGALVAPLVAPLGTLLAAYDHNWDEYEYPLQVLDANYTTADGGSAPVFGAGTAFHCYAGDMSEAHKAVHVAWPSKAIHVSECTGSYPNDVCNVSLGMEGFWANHEWDMRNLFLGAAAHWSSSGLKWVMALDEDCGPVLPQVEYRWGRPLVAVATADPGLNSSLAPPPSSSSSSSKIYYNQDFYTIGHMAKFVPRGSVRVETTTASASPLDFLAESFILPDGETVAVVVLNSETDEALDLLLHRASPAVSPGADGDSDGDLALTVPPRSTAIILW